MRATAHEVGSGGGHLSQLRLHSGMHKSGQQIKVVITFKPGKVKDCMAGSNGSALNREWQSRQTV